MHIFTIMVKLPREDLPTVTGFDPFILPTRDHCIDKSIHTIYYVHIYKISTNFQLQDFVVIFSLSYKTVQNVLRRKIQMQWCAASERQITCSPCKEVLCPGDPAGVALPSRHRRLHHCQHATALRFARRSAAAQNQAVPSTAASPVNCSETLLWLRLVTKRVEGGRQNSKISIIFSNQILRHLLVVTGDPPGRSSLTGSNKGSDDRSGILQGLFGVSVHPKNGRPDALQRWR